MQSLQSHLLRHAAIRRPTLEKLVRRFHKIHLVVTQPDRPKGRGLELVAIASQTIRPEIKSSHHPTRPHQDQRRIPRPTHRPQARRHHRRRLRPHHSPVDARSPSTRQPQSARLAAPEIPRRSAHPMGHRQGETVTGVTTMRIDAGLDTGDILLQQELAIARERHRRNSRPAPRRHRRRSHGRNPARSASRIAIRQHPQDNSRDPRADPQKRRRPRRFFTLGLGNPQPHPRLPTLAGMPTQNSAARPYRSSTRAQRSTQYRQPSCAPIPIACWSAAPTTPRSNSWKSNSKAKSAPRPQTSSAAIALSPTKNWAKASVSSVSEACPERSRWVVGSFFPAYNLG
jgi:hypothetical protein